MRCGEPYCPRRFRGTLPCFKAETVPLKRSETVDFPWAHVPQNDAMDELVAKKNKTFPSRSRYSASVVFRRVILVSRGMMGMHGGVH